MEFVLQISAARPLIRTKLQEAFPWLAYEIIGEDWDYTVLFPDASERDAERLQYEFRAVLYGDGELTLAETVVEACKKRGAIIAFAESCTGGLLSAALVDVAGASQVFHEGLVTYANEAKVERLGVRQETLRRYGAVSEQVAAEMANGLLRKTATLGISVTGIAGPEGGSPEKPVGTVCIGIADEMRTVVHTEHFKGDRQEIRNKAKNRALFHALGHLNQKY